MSPVPSASLRPAFHRALCGVVGLLFSATLHANVTPAPPFSNGAVLQRDKPVPVWGQADPGESVTVTFHDHTATAVADAAGQWSIMLPAMAADRRSAVLTITGQNEIDIEDVLVGEVWLLSGQSNMEMQVSRVDHAAQEIAAADYPLIRHLEVRNRLASTPQRTVENTGWLPVTPETVRNFSAVGYFFARAVQSEIDVPIGLLNISWGGSPIEAWTSAEALAVQPAASQQEIADRWAETQANYPQNLAQWKIDLADYQTREAAATAAGEKALAAFRKANRSPWQPGNPAHGHGRPSAMFNAMIAPFVPYGLRGTLWYQGEANANRASAYRDLFTAMITDWRAKFGQGNLPFYWVQLANFQNGESWPWSGRQWAQLRETQTQTLALPNTGQAVIVDVGDNHDIHPRNKQDVGARLAALALSRIYGISAETTGPTYAGVTREGTRLRVAFDHAGSGLVARDGPARELEIAGADHVFHPAIGEVSGTVLIVSSPAVPAPVAVRYAFTNGMDVNLFGTNGLPVAPFRSDDW